jgi:hypothetical protein
VNRGVGAKDCIYLGQPRLALKSSSPQLNNYANLIMKPTRFMTARQHRAHTSRFLKLAISKTFLVAACSTLKCANVNGDGATVAVFHFCLIHDTKYCDKAKDGAATFL